MCVVSICVCMHVFNVDSAGILFFSPLYIVGYDNLWCWDNSRNLSGLCWMYCSSDHLTSIVKSSVGCNDGFNCNGAHLGGSELFANRFLNLAGKGNLDSLLVKGIWIEILKVKLASRGIIIRAELTISKTKVLVCIAPPLTSSSGQWRHKNPSGFWGSRHSQSGWRPS